MTKTREHRFLTVVKETLKVQKMNNISACNDSLSLVKLPDALLFESDGERLRN